MVSPSKLSAPKGAAWLHSGLRAALAINAGCQRTVYKKTNPDGSVVFTDTVGNVGNAAKQAGLF